MPRSFLVRKSSTNKKPCYWERHSGELVLLPQRRPGGGQLAGHCGFMGYEENMLKMRQGKVEMTENTENGMKHKY